MTIADHLAYALLWLIFGFTHSLLASDTFKTRFDKRSAGSYRLIYNSLSVIHLASVWLASQLWLGRSAIVFQWTQTTHTALALIQIIGVAIIVVALMHYDLGRFSGLTQLRNATNKVREQQPEPLNVTGMHRYVRHPLYLGVYLFLCGGISNELNLATALWASFYLVIGTWFEERKLIRLYGASYEAYRQTVPALIPWKGRAL